MKQTEELKLVDSHLIDAAPLVENNGQVDLHQYILIDREDIEFTEIRGLAYVISLIACLSIGLIGYILMYHFERISYPKCSAVFILTS